MKPSEKVWITYGIEFDIDKFQTPCGYNHLNKPYQGGLWASPKDSTWGWKEFCQSEMFRVGSLRTWTEFKISPASKILIIDSEKDLQGAREQYGTKGPTLLPETLEVYYLDYTKILEAGIDGVYLTQEGYRTNDDIFGGMNYWDCESILILNPDIIEQPIIYHNDEI